MNMNVSPLKGKKQSPEHIAKRMAALKGKPRPTGGGRPANTHEVLWSKVDKCGPDECWPWNGFRNKQGYGRTWIKGVGYYAHRVIFDLANPGIIPLSNHGISVCVMHDCDNPPCCNPAHLKLGTHLDNMRDKTSKGRSPDFRGERAPRAKLTSEEVFWIRMQKKNGATLKALALLYDVSRSAISHCLYGLSYQDVS